MLPGTSRKEVVRLSLLLLACIASSFGLLWLLASQLSSGYGGDFRIFWFVGMHPTGWLYTDLHRLPFPYPPSSLFLFKPLALLPFWTALALWDVISLLVFAAAARRIAPILAVGVGMLSFAVGENVIHGQTGLIVSALVIAGATEQRPWLAGLLLGAAAAVKPQAVIAVPIALLITKEYQTLLWTCIGGGLAIIASLAMFGWSPWFHWVAALGDFRDLIYERNLNEKVVGLTGWSYLFGPPLGLALISANFRRNRYATVALASVLISPYTMTYDLAGLAVLSAGFLLYEKRPVMWISSAFILAGTIFASWGILLMTAATLLLPHRKRLSQVGSMRGHSHDARLG